MEGVETPMSAPPQQTPSTTNDYLRTIRSAVDNIPESRLLTEEKKEKKPPRQQSQREVPDPDDIPDDDTPEPEPEREEVRAAESEVESQREEEPEPEADEDDFEAQKSQQKWHAYKKSHKENPRLKARIAELESQGQSHAGEVEQLRKHVQALYEERQQLAHAVEVGNVEASPRWKDEVTKPLNRMWERIQSIGKKNNLEPKKIADLLNHGLDRDLEEYVSEASIADRSALYNMFEQLSDINDKRRELKENASQLSQSDYQKALSQQNDYYHQVFGERTKAIQAMIPKLEERVMPYIPKDKRHDLREIAKDVLDYDNWKEDAKMYGGYAAVILPDLLDSMKALRAELKQVKADNVKLRGGGPKAGATGSRPPSAKGGEEQVDLTRPLSEITNDMTTRLRRAAGYRG
jgi:hypothetical protein